MLGETILDARRFLLTSVDFQAIRPEVLAIAVRSRDRKGDRTRARLLVAAMAEFRAHGVAGASIARISEAAGLARSAFYFHFPTKIDALRELRDMFEESYANRIAEGGDLEEVLRSLVEGILEARAAVGDPALFGQMLALETDPSTSTTRPSRAVTALVRQFVAARARGELREGLDPEHAAHLCLRCIFGCLIGSARDERSCQRDLTTMASFFQQERGRRSRPSRGTRR